MDGPGQGRTGGRRRNHGTTIPRLDSPFRGAGIERAAGRGPRSGRGTGHGPGRGPDQRLGVARRRHAAGRGREGLETSRSPRSRPSSWSSTRTSPSSIELKDFGQLHGDGAQHRRLPDAPDIIFGNQGYPSTAPLVGAGPDQRAWTRTTTPTAGTTGTARAPRTSSGSPRTAWTFGDGPLWGIAESADFVGVYYNVDKLATLGIEVPTTFAEFEAALAAASEAGELPIKLGNQAGLAGHARAGHRPGRPVAAPRTIARLGLRRGGRRLRSPRPTSRPPRRSRRGWTTATSTPTPTPWTTTRPGRQFAKGDGVFLPAGSWLTADLLRQHGRRRRLLRPAPR